MLLKKLTEENKENKENKFQTAMNINPRILIPVWGENYIKDFLFIFEKTVIQTENIKTLMKHKAIVRILTCSEDLEKIEKSNQIRQAKKLIEVEVIDCGQSIEYSKYNKLSNFFNIGFAIDKESKTEVSYVLLTSDTFFGPTFFDLLFNLSVGFKCVAAPGLRLKKSKIFDLIKNKESYGKYVYEENNNDLSLSDLSWINAEFIHPQMSEHDPFDNRVNLAVPCAIMLKSPKEIQYKTFNLNPFFLSVIPSKVIGRDYGTIDDALLDVAGINDFEINFIEDIRCLPVFSLDEDHFDEKIIKLNRKMSWYYFPCAAVWLFHQKKLKKINFLNFEKIFYINFSNSSKEENKRMQMISIYKNYLYWYQCYIKYQKFFGITTEKKLTLRARILRRAWLLLLYPMSFFNFNGKFHA